MAASRSRRRPSSPPSASRRQRSSKKKGTIGYAVIGLGHIAQVAVLPAFAHAKTNSRLVALVSGDVKKQEKISKKYKARSYEYSQLDECLASDDIDAVYIALPNDMHLEYVQRAARAGVHVLCEKPLGLSTDECEQMIQACDGAGVKLMTAYRLHFEPANLEVVQMAKLGKLGETRFFSSDFSYQVSDSNIRIERERGGGPLWDIGIYCLNAARYCFQSEPTEVFARAVRGTDPRFEEVDEAVSGVLRFPDARLATFTCSFGAAATGSFRLVGSKGDVRLDNCYEYVGRREMTVTLNEKSKKRTFKPVDQFAPELRYFSDAILNDTQVEPSGWEGLADIRVIEALNRSIAEDRMIELPPFEKKLRPSLRQRDSQPPVRKPELVNAQSAHS